MAAALGESEIRGRSHNPFVFAFVADVGIHKPAGLRAVHESGFGFVEEFRDLTQLAGAEERVHLRQLLKDLIPMLLHEAPGDVEFFAVFGDARGVQDRVDRFFFSGFNEGAGMNDDRFGVFRLFDDAVTPGFKTRDKSSVSAVFFRHSRASGWKPCS